jgi:hypothetical protein
MKSKFFILSASFLLWGIILTGCKQNTANIDRVNDITFDTITVNEQYHLLGDSANPFCMIESAFIYPSGYKDREILQKINRIFLISFFGEDSPSASPEEVMKNYADKYISDYMELEKDFPGKSDDADDATASEALYSHFEISSNEILYNKCNLISYVVSIEYFTGGAHGNQGYDNHVIDLSTGNELEEKDIFVDNYQDSLAQIIVDAIAAGLNLSDPAELENMGFFNIREIYPNGNLYVDGDGITYTYNSYEIAAYSVGKTDVTLPYDRIRHLIREDSPVAPLAFAGK